MSTRKSLVGKTFGNLTVLRDSGQRVAGSTIVWECQCNCEDKNIVLVRTTYLTTGYITCCKQMLNMPQRDLMGMTFGRWKVIKREENSNCDRPQWLCECQCKNKTLKVIPASYLKSGQTKSCGCLKLEQKRNEYKFTEEYGIGYTTKGEEFYFDLEDYELIKNFRWHISGTTGYVTTYINKKHTVMHRIVMNVTNPKIQIDHIYGVKYDNRKSSLRVVDNRKNSFNKKVKGVYWSNNRNRWVAHIVADDIRKSKYFHDFDEAVAQRKAWEQEFFGEFAYQEPPQSYIEELNELSKVN